jgi:uncharacterized protein YggE
MSRYPIALAIVCTAVVAGPNVREAKSDEDPSVISVEGRYQGNPFEGKIRFGADARTLSVIGTGKVSAAPDVAEISVGVVTTENTAKEAVAVNNATMEALQRALKERGVAAKDIETSRLSINPQYAQLPPPAPGQQPKDFIPRIVGYQVTNTVKITARDIMKLGTILDAAVEAGANQMYGISFRVDKPEKLLDVARKDAMADAKRKAELMAGEAGMVVGRPTSIREEGAATAPPRPAMFGRQAVGMAAAVPISAGEQELGVSVHVVYELKAPK